MAPESLAPESLAPESLALRLRQALQPLDTEIPPPAHGTVAAAVLVPIVWREGRWSIVLTQRTRHLSRHAGQVSLPGGRIEPGDASPEAAALRETEEEIGLSPARVTIVGRLATRLTGTGFSIAPIVGLIEAPFTLKPDPGEVETVFEIPLALALERRNYRTEPAERDGVRYTIHILAHDSYHIWGATARILYDLAAALDLAELELARLG